MSCWISNHFDACFGSISLHQPDSSIYHIFGNKLMKIKNTPWPFADIPQNPAFVFDLFSFYFNDFESELVLHPAFWTSDIDLAMHYLRILTQTHAISFFHTSDQICCSRSKSQDAPAQLTTLVWELGHLKVGIIGVSGLLLESQGGRKPGSDLEMSPWRKEKSLSTDVKTPVLRFIQSVCASPLSLTVSETQVCSCDSSSSFTLSKMLI